MMTAHTSKESTMGHPSERTVKVINKGPLGALAFMAYIGAAIYFIQASDGTFLEVVLGLLQAAVWPVYVIFHVLQMIGA